MIKYLELELSKTLRFVIGLHLMRYTDWNILNRKPRFYKTGGYNCIKDKTESYDTVGFTGGKLTLELSKVRRI